MEKTRVCLRTITGQRYACEVRPDDVHFQVVEGLAAYNKTCLDIWIPSAYDRQGEPSRWDVVRVSESRAQEAGLDGFSRWTRRVTPKTGDAEVRRWA